MTKTYPNPVKTEADGWGRPIAKKPEKDGWTTIDWEFAKSRYVVTITHDNIGDIVGSGKDLAALMAKYEVTEEHFV